jgi:hypothetical protein
MPSEDKCSDVPEGKNEPKNGKGKTFWEMHWE